MDGVLTVDQDISLQEIKKEIGVDQNNNQFENSNNNSLNDQNNNQPNDPSNNQSNDQNKPIKSGKSSKIKVLSLVFVLLLIIVLVLVFLFNPFNLDSEIDLEQDVGPDPIDVIPEPVDVVSDTFELIDCESDLLCFISSIEDNDLALVNHSFSMSIFGVMIQTTTNYLEIKDYDLENNEVELFIRNDGVEIEVEDESVFPEESMIGMREMFEQMKGREGNCLFDKEDLLEVLLNWSEFNFGANDFEKGNCAGEYFETITS